MDKQSLINEAKKQLDEFNSQLDDLEVKMKDFSGEAKWDLRLRAAIEGDDFAVLIPVRFIVRRSEIDQRRPVGAGVGRGGFAKVDTGAQAASGRDRILYDWRIREY